MMFGFIKNQHDNAHILKYGFLCSGFIVLVKIMFVLTLVFKSLRGNIVRVLTEFF